MKQGAPVSTRADRIAIAQILRTLFVLDPGRAAQQHSHPETVGLVAEIHLQRLRGGGDAHKIDACRAAEMDQLAIEIALVSSAEHQRKAFERKAPGIMTLLLGKGVGGKAQGSGSCCPACCYQGEVRRRKGEARLADQRWSGGIYPLCIQAEFN
jgi:hypothetical protein